MKCPHCLTDIHSEPTDWWVGHDKHGEWGIERHDCPACERLILFLVMGTQVAGEKIVSPQFRQLVYPKGISRAPVPKEVPQVLAEDYREACVTLVESPKASAALSRRCLQHILRDAARVNPSDLWKEIDEVVNCGALPSHISESLDAVRQIGNFAAHPTKSKATGEIVPVEAGEAEWNLDVIEALFDFYFVQPARTKARKDALNKKLVEAGKNPIK